MYSNFTLLDLLKEMSLSTNASQISRLGIDISKFARANGIRYTKVRQVEKGHSVKVNLYPFESKFLLKGAVHKFLEPKRRRYRRVRRQRLKPQAIKPENYTDCECSQTASYVNPIMKGCYS